MSDCNIKEVTVVWAGNAQSWDDDWCIVHEQSDSACIAEAAIKRACAIKQPIGGMWPERPDAWFNGYASAMADVRRTLNGDDND